jgi:hypothetical protein
MHTFAEMDRAEKDAAMAALQREVDLLSAAVGPVEAVAVRAAAARAIPNLIQGDAGAFKLMVEHPRYPGDFDFRTISSPALDVFMMGDAYREAMANARSSDDANDHLRTMGEFKPTPLGEALQLLVGPSNPEDELARRRADIAGRRAAEEKARAATEAKRLEDEAASRTFQRENARRQAAWDACHPVVQAMAIAAEEMPEHRRLVAILTRAAQSGKRLAMPPSFRPDLADPSVVTGTPRATA